MKLQVISVDGSSEEEKKEKKKKKERKGKGKDGPVKRKIKREKKTYRKSVNDFFR